MFSMVCLPRHHQTARRLGGKGRYAPGIRAQMGIDRGQKVDNFRN
jgi:hypothetical protein